MKTQEENLEQSSKDNNFVNQYLKDEKQKSKVLNYQEDFMDKPYLKEYKSEKIIASLFSYVSHLISFASAFFLMYALLYTLFNNGLLAGFFAGVILVLFEATKRNVLTKTLVKYFKHGKPYMALALFAVAISFFSGLLSVEGIKQYYQKEIVKPPTLVNIDSINKVYQNRAKEIEAQKKGFQASVTWKGKINIYNKTTSKTLTSFDRQIGNLQKEQKQTVARNEAKNNNAMALHSQNTNINTLYFALFALANELIYILCICFVINYKYRVQLETKIYNNPRVYSVTISDFQRAFEAGFQHANGFTSPISNSAQEIGFKQDNGFFSKDALQEQNQGLSKENQGKQEPCKEKIKFELLQDLKQGTNQVNQLCKKHKVNPQMVRRAKTLLGTFIL